MSDPAGENHQDAKDNHGHVHQQAHQHHPHTEYYLIFDIINGERKWNKLWLLFFTIVVPVVIAVKVHFAFPGFFSNVIEEAHGPVSEHIFKLFKHFDIDNDNCLNPYEFQKAFFDIKSGAIHQAANLTDLEKENFHEDVQSILKYQIFKDDVQMLNLNARMKPMDLNTMKKFKDHDSLFEDPTMIHLQGLQSWKVPHIESANFSVSNFSRVFLPHPPTDISMPGSLWELVPDKVITGRHLANYRYLPPIPTSQAEKLFLYLLSMFQKRPFLLMRFPPRGAVACLRGFNEEYFDIMFRLHPEFQLNEPPQFPFWFTPAAFVGEIIIKKDGSHVNYFNMQLPSHNKLNIDMEWITSERPNSKENSTVSDAHGQEVDIGYMEEMSIQSSRPSSYIKDLKEKVITTDVNEIKWEQRISYKEAYNILEKKFYPFKEVPYVKFNESLQIAKSEGKMIHHVLLWGSLDDQSC